MTDTRRMTAGGLSRLSLLAPLLFILQACASATAPMPVGSAPPAPAPAPVPAPAPAPAGNSQQIAGPGEALINQVSDCMFERACTSVRVFYGTNRAVDLTQPIERLNTVGTANVSPFAAVEGEAGLTLGSVTISVPCLQGEITTAARGCRRRFADIPRPGEISAFGASYRAALDPYRHFVFYRAETLSRADFAAEVSDVEQAFVFVHGFNVSFKNAAMTAAQLKEDSQFPGEAFIYSWPTRHAPDYIPSRRAAEAARDHFRSYIDFVLEETGAEQIHVIAHSMGNYLIMPVLADMAAEQVSDEPVFGELIFAAPDINAEAFADYAQQIDGLGRGLTLYASANDLAMQASIQVCRLNNEEEFCGFRAGDVGPSGPVTLPNVETIDVSALDGDFFAAGLFDDFGHGYFNEDRNLIQDIGVLISSGVRPPERRNPTLRRIEAEDGEFWRFP